MTAYYKWLRADNSSPIGQGRWIPGEWRSVEGELIPCANGLHLCREAGLLEHISQRLWTAEADESEIIHECDNVVVRRARIIKQVETINDCTLRLFACDCAARVAHLAKDERSHNAIAVARRFAHRQATEEERHAACKGARAAAESAAYDAAFAPGGAASAMYAAAFAAVRAAVESATYAAALAAATRGDGITALTGGAAENSRLLQYVKYGEAAEAMLWEAGK